MSKPALTISEDDIKQVLSSVSHDVKNNLTPLYLYLELLRKAIHSERDQKKVDQIKKSAEAIELYCHTITELSKAYYDRYTGNFTKESVHSVQNILKPYIQTFAYKNIALEDECKIDLDLCKRMIKVLSVIVHKEDSTILIEKNKNVTAMTLTFSTKLHPTFSQELMKAYTEKVLSILAKKHTISNEVKKLSIYMELED